MPGGTGRKPRKQDEIRGQIPELVPDSVRNYMGETIVAILMLLMILLFVGIALDLARWE